MSEAEKPSFEESLAALEALVKGMESGQLSLDQLIESFEKGNRLVKLCRSRMEQLEERIELLTKDDGKQGEWSDFVPENFRDSSSSDSTPF